MYRGDCSSGLASVAHHPSFEEEGQAVDHKQTPHNTRAVPQLMLRMAMPQNHLLEMDAKRSAAPTWETVRYMVSAIQYGGRITDELDKLLMDTYAEKYFQQVHAHHCCC